MSLGWSQSRVNSISQLAQMYPNVVAQNSQTNFVQQQQQQQQQPNNLQQPMQPQQYSCYPTNQQGNYAPNQYGQPYQQEPYGVQPHQQIPRSGVGNLGQPIGQTAYNVPSIMQSQAHGYGSLPAHILDQIRAYIGTPAPIFILPNNCPTPVSPPQAVIPPGPATGQGCPGIGINCPSAPMYCPPGTCYPYPMAMPVFSPFLPPNQNSKESSKNCGCCSRKYPGNPEANATSTYSTNESDEHHCSSGNDETICTKRNCPSAINLQALASQLLAIQGIIPCAATRLVLRKVTGSNVTSTMEETVERAKRSLGTLTQEQLLAETRHAQQVNALINLHMTANPPPNVIPILTTVQLKVNLLKAYVDSSINRRLSESQGAVGNACLDPVILALKSDQELRDLLGTLRQKECEERVNLNFAPYQSQRVVAESRLSNIQNKICQVESEMERRRGAAVPGNSVARQFSDPGWYDYNVGVGNAGSSGGPTQMTQNYESPDPFGFQARNHKRLNLPHVGSPESTYERPKKSSSPRPSRARKDSDDEDAEENTKNSARDPSAENHRCACEKSSDEDSADEAKKKLGGKIVVGRDTNEGDRQMHREVSILKLSKNVVIVIDNSCSGRRRNEDFGDIDRLVEERVKNEVKTEVDSSENPDEMKNQSSAGTTVNDNDKNNAETMAGKMRKFKWGKKKDKIADLSVDKKAVDPPEVEEKQEIKNEDDFENELPVEDAKRDDYYREPDGPEPVREQTVRMITKIDYEPSVFRAFRNPVDEPPEKDSVIEERFKGSFTEDSLKSNSLSIVFQESSVDSTVDSNRTPESMSLQAEEFADASSNPALVLEDEQHIVGASPIEVLQVVETGIEAEKFKENSRTMDKINDGSERVHRSSLSRHNDENDDESIHEDHPEEDTPEYRQEGTEDDSISGTSMKLDAEIKKDGKWKFIKFADFDNEIGESSNSEPRALPTIKHLIIEDKNRGNHPEEDTPEYKQEGTEDDSISGTSMKLDAEMKKDGKWKFIKFADFDNEFGESSNSESRALPKIKHLIIEDKNRGSKYVVIEEPSYELQRELGEPYRTVRSLIKRSRPRSPQSSSSEQSRPITVVKSPTQRHANCLALHFVSPKATKKNRCSRDLKSSDKFWLRPETREEQSVEANEMEDLLDRESRPETSESMTNPVDEKTSSVADSGTSVNSEHVVEVHEYSKSVASSRMMLLRASHKTENTDTVASSIA